MNVYKELKQERDRQISKGYDEDHDCEHFPGTLCTAAGVYADAAAYRMAGLEIPSSLEQVWPFSNGFKPYESARPYMLKAAAMLIAEIELYDKMVGEE